MKEQLVIIYPGISGPAENTFPLHSQPLTITGKPATPPDSQLTSADSPLTVTDWQLTTVDTQLTAAGSQLTPADCLHAAAGRPLTPADWVLTLPDCPLTATDWQLTPADYQLTAADCPLTPADWASAAAENTSPSPEKPFTTGSQVFSQTFPFLNRLFPPSPQKYPSSIFPSPLGEGARRADEVEKVWGSGTNFKL